MESSKNVLESAEALCLRACRGLRCPLVNYSTKVLSILPSPTPPWWAWTGQLMYWPKVLKPNEKNAKLIKNWTHNLNILFSEIFWNIYRPNLELQNSYPVQTLELQQMIMQHMSTQINSYNKTTTTTTTTTTTRVVEY